MNLDQMIIDAQARRAAVEADVRADRERCVRKEVARHQEVLVGLFGDLVPALDMVAESISCATLTFHDQPYRLYENRQDWRLVRQDERSDDDERRRPSREFYTSYSTLRDNQDFLLLALAELADEPDVPFPPRRVVEAAPAPRVMGESEAQLLDALRTFLQSEL